MSTTARRASSTGPAPSGVRDVPHPRLTSADRAAIDRAVTRWTAATFVALAGIAAGAALAALVPVAGAALLLLTFLTGVAAFSRRLDLTHPRPGSRWCGKPLTVRVNPVAAAAYAAWLDEGGRRDDAEAGEIVGLVVELADLAARQPADGAAERSLTDRLVALTAPAGPPAAATAASGGTAGRAPR